MADPHNTKLGLKVGLFVFVAILIIIIFIIAIGFNKNVFSRKINITVATDTAENITKGMPVKYAGFTIGRVHNYELTDDGRVILHVKISAKYKIWVKENSKIFLNAQNILGSSYISIQTNKDSESPEIVSGSHFEELKRDQGLQGILEQATPVVGDLKDAIKNLNTILGAFADKDGDFSKIMAGLGALGSDIKNKEGSIGYLTRSEFLQQEITKFLDDIKEFSSSAVRLAHNVESSSITLKRALEIFDYYSVPIVTGTNEVVAEAQSMVQIIAPVIARLDSIAANLEKASKNAADGTENLDELRNEMQSIVESGNDLILKIQNTWPISIGNKKTPEKVPLK